MTRLKIRQIGNSQGVLIPKEMLGAVNAGLGDEFVARVTSKGLIELTPEKAETDSAALLGKARKIMAKRRKVLRALAK
jgi:putative addiction module antidote